MTKPTNIQLSEHVLRDMMKQMSGSPSARTARTVPLEGTRGATLVTFLVFGWFVIIYPVWMFSRRPTLKLFEARWHTEDRYDCTVKLGLFGVDILPYKKPANLDNVNIA